MAAPMNSSPRERRPRALGLFVLIALVQIVRSDSGVLIRSKYGQSLTSSTLHWISIDRDSLATTNLPENVIEAGQEGTRTTYICRTYHSGISLLGSSDGMSCSIVFYDAIYSYGRFDVLVNPNGAARLVWTAWDRSKPIPTGAIENGGHYVARRKANENVYIARMNPNDLRGKLYIAEAAIVREFTDGELLVEVEPVAYEINQLDWSYSKQRTVSSTLLPLAETVLVNFESEKESLISTAVPIALNRSIYLRQMHGVDKTIPVLVRLPESPKEILQSFWSQRTEIPETHVESVSRRIPYGFAVNVTVTGTRITTEAPYTASLKTVYADGKTAERKVDGTAQQTIIKDLKISYGEPYLVNDPSALPVAVKSTTAIPVKDKGKFFLIDADQQLDEPRDDSFGPTSTQPVSIVKEAKSTEAALTHGSAPANSSQSLWLSLALFSALLRYFP